MANNMERPDVRSAGGEKPRAKPLKTIQAEACRFWGGFLAAAVVLFWLFSSGTFSFLLTLSSLVSAFSFVMVMLKILQHRSARGVSRRMMECYCIVFVFRLCAIVPFEGYLPYDKSGDWLYQLCEAAALCLAAAIVYCCRVRYVHTCNPGADSLNNLWLIVPALVSALFLHPHLNNYKPSDICWAFALNLESVAVLCQFFMFMNETQVQTHTVHFLAAQALSKFMSFIFWASSFSELANPKHYFQSSVGFWVIGMQTVQLLIMVDFIHNYLWCIWHRVSVTKVLCTDNMV